MDRSAEDFQPVLTTTMTTFRLPDTLNYTTVEFTSCMFTPSARAYGSEG